MAGQVLVADGVATSRILLRVILAAAHYDVRLAADATAARRLIDTTQPDFILLGDTLEDGPSDDLLRYLRNRPDTRNVPVILLSDRATSERRIAALSAGADELMRKPVGEAALLARMRSLLRAHETTDALDQRQAAVHDLGFAETKAAFAPPAKIALIADDAARAARWADAIAPHMTHGVRTLGHNDVLARAQQGSVADVYVIEASVSDPGAGLRLLTELRARPQSRHAAIVIVHDVTDTETAVNALDLGASDLLELGFHPQEMALRLTIQLDRKRDADRLRETVAEGLRLAVLDPLTGLFNRRYAMAHIARTAERAAQTGKPYAVVLADIDLFKSVNDRFGHPAGDAVIAHVAQSLRNHLRPIDMVSRIGGEEFMIVMPETSPARAEATAKRLCAAVRARSAPVAGAMGGLPVTVSLGVSMGAPGERPENAIDRADRALYAAKEAGRDKVSVDSMNAA